MALPSDKAVAMDRDGQENYPEAMVDVDDMMLDKDDEMLDAQPANDRFASSAELRRKIEERHELKLMRDELGFDDDLGL